MLKFVGGIFAGVGGFFAVTGVALCIHMQGEPLLGFMFFGMGMLFVILGGSFIYSEVKKSAFSKKIIRDGIKYDGKIVSYDDADGIAVNGVLPVAIVVKLDCANEDGEEIIVTCPTGGTSTAKYPIHARCTVSILGSDARIIPASVSIMR